MYAILEIGGKQYKVAQDDIIEVNKIEQDDNSSVTLDKVILVADGENIKVGQPYVAGANVEAEVLAQTKAPKVIIYKYLRRKDSHKKTGHRQKLTKLLIKKINN
ncbi:MAG: 50S ribosomal protein L21 [Candidatus Omnitrophota bacterium]